MNKIIKGLLIILGRLGIYILSAAYALLGGTIIYWLWPCAIPFLFPAQVASGALLATVPWWPTILFVWICGILFNSSIFSFKS